MRRTTWLGLLLATFIVPAGLALLIGRSLPLATAEMQDSFGWARQTSRGSMTGVSRPPQT